MENASFPKSLIEFLVLLKENGIPETDYQKYTGNFFEFSSREKGIPLHGTFELTPLCNLNCKMCYVHLNNDQFNHEQLIDVFTWKNLIEQAYNSGMRNATLTGGECLTYPGFDDIYLYLYKKRIRIGILSNGTLLDRDRISFLKQFPPKNIQITVYGSNNDAYERVTGERVFDIVRANIFMIRDAGLPLHIAITPSKYMWDDIENVLETVEKFQVPYYINSFLSAPRKNTGRNKEDMTVDQYISMYKKRDSLKNWKEFPLVNPAELPEPSHSSEKRIGLKCGAGRSTFVIKHDGTMSPCVSLSYITSNPLQIGFSQAWKQINDVVNAYVLPAECGDCFYSSVCLKCITLHKDAPIEGHCNPSVCERTKKMISAGIIPMPSKTGDKVL